MISSTKMLPDGLHFTREHRFWNADGSPRTAVYSGRIVSLRRGYEVADVEVEDCYGNRYHLILGPVEGGWFALVENLENRACILKGDLSDEAYNYICFLACGISPDRAGFLGNVLSVMYAYYKDFFSRPHD